MSQVAPRSSSFIGFERSELERSLVARFEEIVALYPDRLAVKCKTAELSYCELNETANRIAGTLLNRYGRTEEAVGVLVQEESQAIAAILGVLKAGRFYVPLDRTFPPDRLRSIINDCQLQVLLTEQQFVGWANDLGADCAVIALEDIDARTSAENAGLIIEPLATAAIFYTSGTTGQPKGVIQDHQSVLHRVMQGTNALGIGCDDRLTLLSAPTYSASLRNLFTALLTGAAVYPFRVLEEGITPLGAWLQRERISIYTSVPSLFRRWAAALTGQEDFSHLRIVELIGEGVTSSDVEQYRKSLPPTCVLVNVLSSNEAGTIRRYIVDHSTEIAGPVVPVGYPVDDKEILILDDEGREVSGEQVGEIAVRSRFLSPGYWKRPELTDSVFVTDPVKTGERIYRTGDLGCLLPDGCLLHKGRKDSRAKIRGIRVETEEIEAALHTHPSVQDAAVVIHAEPTGGQTLMAHVAGKDGADLALNSAELRTFLANVLPDFMVPAVFVFHEALPHLANGKIDRRGLLAPDRKRPDRDTTGDRPLDALECDLAGIWAALLGVHPIHLRDNFFELGGDSLKAAELAARIEKTFNQRLAPLDIIRSPTVEQLGAILRRDRAPEPWSPLIRLQSGDGKRSVFCFPFAGGFKQELFYLADLAARVRRDYAFYGVMARGSDGQSTPHLSVEEMAADCIGEIKKVQATGPYFLFGHCLSGQVAYETARQLRASGENVGMLCLFDAWGAEPWWARYVGRRLNARMHHHTAPLRDWWRLARERMTHQRREIWRLRGSGARVGYLIDKFRRVLSTIIVRTRGATTHPQLSVVEANHAVNGDARHLNRAFNAHILAVRRYRRRPYDGTITLIATEEWCQLHPTLGWGPDDSLEIHRIPGRHETFMREQIHLIADVLRGCFERAEQAAAEAPRAAARTRAAVAQR